MGVGLKLNKGHDLSTKYVRAERFVSLILEDGRG